MEKFNKATEPEELDFYSIYKRNEKKEIHVFGYTYYGDKWNSLEVCWFIEELADFIKHLQNDEEYVNTMYSELKQYQQDFSDEETVNCINHYFDGEPADYRLPFSEITMETPCGNYVC